MPGSSTITPRGRKARDRIIAAAVELTAEKGAASVSLDEVCVRAPASRSQVYHYFENRDDLIRAVVRATVEAELAAHAEVFARLESREGLERWFTSMEEAVARREARGGSPLGSLVAQLAERDPAARGLLADGFDRWEGRLRDGLERLQQHGHLPGSVNPRQLAIATLALLQGGLLLSQVRRDADQLRVALDAARRLLTLAG